MHMQSKGTKERIIENHLRHYNTYRVAIMNCEKQLEYIMPSLVSQFGSDGTHSIFYVGNNTERVALDRIESKRALDLKEEILQYQLVVESIDNAIDPLQENEKVFVNLRYFDSLPIRDVKEKMGYSEEKSIFRIRRNVLDKLMISLNNLLSLK